jgi:hypothetical protein
LKGLGVFTRPHLIPGVSSWGVVFNELFPGPKSSEPMANVSPKSRIQEFPFWLMYVDVGLMRWDDHLSWLTAWWWAAKTIKTLGRRDAVGALQQGATVADSWWREN